MSPPTLKRIQQAGLRLLAGLSMLAAGAPLALAQDWPVKPIRIVVPYTPGGSSDIIARAISQPLSEALKRPVVVEISPHGARCRGLHHVAAGVHAVLLA